MGTLHELEGEHTEPINHWSPTKKPPLYNEGFLLGFLFGSFIMALIGPAMTMYFLYDL